MLRKQNKLFYIIFCVNETYIYTQLNTNYCSNDEYHLCSVGGGASLRNTCTCIKKVSTFECTHSNLSDLLIFVSLDHDIKKSFQNNLKDDIAYKQTMGPRKLVLGYIKVLNFIRGTQIDKVMFLICHSRMCSLIDYKYAIISVMALNKSL